jgi:hypothetical protein
LNCDLDEQFGSELLDDVSVNSYVHKRQQPKGCSPRRVATAALFVRPRGDTNHEGHVKQPHSSISSTISERPSLDEQSQPSPKLLVGEAAQFLRCSASFLNKKRVTGGGPPFIKLGKKVLYDRQDLENWLRSTKRRRTA